MKNLFFGLAVLCIVIPFFSFVFKEKNIKDCQWSSPIIRNCKLESSKFDNEGNLSGRVTGICPKCQKSCNITSSFHFWKPTYSGQNDKWWDRQSCYNHKGEKENPYFYDYSVNVTSICK